VVANWRLYGTSGWEQPPEGLVIENYLMRAPDEYDGNRQVKSIVNPRSAMGWASSAHHFRLLGDAVGEDRRPIKFAVREPTADVWQNTHNHTRGEGEWGGKIQMPGPSTAVSGGGVGPPADAIRDETILQFAPQLRELLSSRPGGPRHLHRK